MDDLNRLLQAMEAHGDRTALVQAGSRLSYRELFCRAASVARFLISLGFGEKRALATALPACREQVIVHLAAFLAGVPLIRVRSCAAPAQFAHCLRSFTPHGLVTTKELRESLRGEYSLDGLIVVDPFDWRDDLAGSRGQAKDVVGDFAAVNADRMATVTFTSGTTARFKGVIHSRRALAQAIRRSCAIVGYQPTDVVLVRMPLYAQIGMVVQCLPALLVGATVELATQAPMDAYVHALSTEPDKTLVFDAPTILANLMRHPEIAGLGVGRLRMVWAGGDFVASRTQARARAIGGQYITVAYGMTEVGLICVLKPDEQQPQNGLVGYPLPDTELRIMDDAGHELPLGQRGNIEVRTPSAFDGYWNLPDLTRSVLSPDGWVATGDIGEIDASGRLQLLGRRKEMILIDARCIAPVEVETVLVSHPGVQEAAVAGVGEEEEENPRIEAFIVLREGFEPSPSREDLLDLARQRLEPAMVPAEVHFVKRLPIFPTGKLDRERLAMVSLAGLWDELR